MSDGVAPNRALLWLALFTIALPVLLVDIAPLCDLPNHLGRIAVHHRAGTETAFTGQPVFYEWAWAALPNLAIDAFATPLSLLLGPVRAVQVFVLLTALAPVVGAALVARAQGRSTSLAAALAALFVHSIAFEYGLLNYALGLGVMLCALAAWIGLSGRSAAIRIASSSVLALVLFFCHLMPLAFYAVLVTAFELSRVRREGTRKVLCEAPVAAAQFVAPALLYLAFSPTREGGVWLMPELAKKLSQLPSFLWIGHAPWDWVFTAGVAALAVLIVAIGRPHLGRGGWLALAGLALVFAVAPQKTATADNISIRVPPALALTAAAFVSCGVRQRRRALVLSIAIAALLVGRAAQVTLTWTRDAPVYEDVRAALAEIPDGATVVTLRDVPNRRNIRTTWHPPLAHAACLALLDRNVFVPQLFANPGQQPLVIAERLRPLRGVRGDYLPTYTSDADFAAWIDALRQEHERVCPNPFDLGSCGALCVFCVHDGPLPLGSLAGIERLGSGARWTLLRID